MAFSEIYEVINLTVLDLFNFSLFCFICRFFILEFRIFYSLPLDFIVGSSLYSSSLVGGPFCCSVLGVPSMRDVASESLFCMYYLCTEFMYGSSGWNLSATGSIPFLLSVQFILAIFAECFIFNIFNRSFQGSRSWIPFFICMVIIFA